MGDSGAGATTLLVSFEANEISADPADSLSFVPVRTDLPWVEVFDADSIHQLIGVWYITFAGLLAAWAPSAGSLSAVWVIVVVVFGVSVDLTIVIVAVAPVE